MIAISKERLAQIANETHDSDDSNMAVLSLLDMLINECKELDPWLPIEDAPRDRKIKAYNPYLGQYITRYTNGQWPCFGASELGGMKISNEDGASIHYPQPTHYKELSEDPKELAK